ncbi:hypothetical protein BpHYR1_034057 [Brachionus plicatilis]|uniref:Uncharacterized protein n=1 Tax=Brachionus plicatilis TaxID=10195 RepID=A0A3M7S010_BRAPC|nr:hypothetical protein BpHYR1_034057 [Brachionus plicatilis]
MRIENRTIRILGHRFEKNFKLKIELFLLVITTITIIIDRITSVTKTMTILITIARCITVSTTISSNTRKDGFLVLQKDILLNTIFVTQIKNSHSN